MMPWGAIIAELYEVPFVKLSDKTIADTLLPIVPYRLASSQYIMPFKQENGQLHIACNNPHAFELLNSLSNKTGLDIIPHYATKKELKKSFESI